MSDYRPIACVEHEKLEFAVLKRQALRLAYADTGGGIRELLIQPLDVFTKEGAEWLLFLEQQSGESRTIRLDSIKGFSPA